jgi:hypothetical protein
MLWRRPLVRREKIVVERCVGAWECVCSREIELLSVVWIEGRGFVVELRFWRYCQHAFTTSRTVFDEKQRKFRVYMRKRRDCNGRREGERDSAQRQRPSSTHCWRRLFGIYPGDFAFSCSCFRCKWSWVEMGGKGVWRSYCVYAFMGLRPVPSLHLSNTLDNFPFLYHRFFDRAFFFRIQHIIPCIA